MELDLRSAEPQGAHEAGGAAPTLVDRWRSPDVDLLPVFLYIPKIFSVKFQVIPRTFISAQKQHHGSSAENSVSPGLVSFKSCKLESKTRGKVLGKLDTLETYQLPQA